MHLFLSQFLADEMFEEFGVGNIRNNHSITVYMFCR